jgi:hypothetical protein
LYPEQITVTRRTGRGGSLHWIGSSRGLLAFPGEVVTRSASPRGPPAAPTVGQAWKGLGPGVRVVKDGRDLPRGSHVRSQGVYARHVFQKSPTGIRTALRDVRLIEERLKVAREDYEARYGGEEDRG